MKPIPNISGMPHMRAALSGWMQPITLMVVAQSVVDGLIIDTTSSITFRGTVQPLSAQQLNLKPEGERSWEWLQIHALDRTLNLTTNDKITYNNKNYKVMAVWNYTLNGFMEYHVCKDYE